MFHWNKFDKIGSSEVLVTLDISLCKGAISKP